MLYFMQLFLTWICVIFHKQFYTSLVRIYISMSKYPYSMLSINFYDFGSTCLSFVANASDLDEFHLSWAVFTPMIMHAILLVLVLVSLDLRVHLMGLRIKGGWLEFLRYVCKKFVYKITLAFFYVQLFNVSNWTSCTKF